MNLKEIQYLQYPACQGKLKNENELFHCEDCHKQYPVVSEIPIFLIPEEEKEKKYISHYKTDAEAFDYFRVKDKQVTHDSRRIEEYVSSFIPKGSRRILDVGSGRAWVARRFTDEQTTVWSLDITLTNVRKALDRITGNTHMGVVADANNLPFADGTFDCVISTEVVEHVREPGTFINSLLRVVKPGGKLILTTMFREKIVYSLCIHCNQLTPHNAHLHSFDEKNLLNAANDDQVAKKQWRTFGNKLLTRTRSHWLMDPMPFGLWKVFDKAVSGIVHKPERIIAVFTRR